MKYRLRYLKLAQSDLQEIADFNRRFSEKYQTEILSKIEQACSGLKDSPENLPDYRLAPSFKRLIVNDYLVFFKVDGTTHVVSIYRILHAKRDTLTLLKDDI
ncbi:MAG: type II toxin-antitoxin system RelE/ParE family toxin [Coriobacteriia bacterium]|nr:type II toxin-antitoxin system RelE/ParE family toxin [Coriobacteriia bacterium]